MSSDDDFDDAVAAVTYDTGDDSVVVIIGSGAGGGTLANELCQKGIDVVVIEAGPRIDSTQLENDEYAMYDLLTWSDKRACTGTSPIVQNFPDAPTWVCKGVGGSTLHWAGLAIRFLDFEFKARSVYGEVAGADVADWPITLDDLAPYYDKAEHKMGVAGTNGIPLHPPGNNYKVLTAGARRIGYSQMDTGSHAINPLPRDGRNACDQIGFCMQGCKSGAKWSTANAEIPKAEASGRCEIRAECMALAIHHDEGGRVSGVLYADKQGDRHFQKARIVCVAANSIETARLLLNSASGRFPDGLANSSGLVGRNFMCHMTGYAYAELDRAVNMHRGNPTAGVIRDEMRHDPLARFRRRLLYRRVLARPALLWRLPRSRRLGANLRGLDRGVRPYRGLVRPRRGPGDRDQSGHPSRDRERRPRSADPVPAPRQSRQRNRDEELRLPQIERALRGGRRETRLRGSAASGLA